MGVHCKSNQNYKYSGSDCLEDVGWFNENTSEVQAVKQLDLNHWGLYDISKNVAEWCHDIWVESYEHRSSNQVHVNPVVSLSTIIRYDFRTYAPKPKVIRLCKERFQYE